MNYVKLPKTIICEFYYFSGGKKSKKYKKKFLNQKGSGVNFKTSRFYFVIFGNNLYIKKI